MEHATPSILLLVLLFLGPLFVYIYRIKHGAMYELKAIKGINEIEHAVHTSIERGRPVVFTTGMTDVSPLLFACLGVLSFIAKRVARLKGSLIVPVRDPEAVALIDATIQQSYASVKRQSDYDPGQVRFLSSEQLAFASGYQGVVHRENAGTAFLFGSFAAESLILAEAGQHVGAMQIAATVSNEQIPFFITSCDYTLLGEELFAASAYVTKDPTQIASIRAQDVAKLFLLILVVCGMLLATFSQCGLSVNESVIKSVIEFSWSEFISKIIIGV